MIYADGLDQLILDLDELAEMPESVIHEMLEAGGEIIAEGQRAQINAMGLVSPVNGGRLEASIQVDHKMRGSGGSQRFIYVYPHGEHHQYRGRRKVKAYKRSKHGRTYSYGGGIKTASANDVGFVQELGSARNPANQWMRIANEKNAPAAVDAEFKVYDDYLKSKNL